MDPLAELCIQNIEATWLIEVEQIRLIPTWRNHGVGNDAISKRIPTDSMASIFTKKLVPKSILRHISCHPSKDVLMHFWKKSVGIFCVRMIMVIPSS
jgi:hypothetical protein